jgi:hypothetical protein
VEKIGELLKRSSDREVGVVHKSWTSLWPPPWAPVSGYLDIADMGSDYNPRWVVYGVDKSLGSEQVEMSGFGMPLPLTRQQEYKAAQVVYYEPALKLLAELYDKVALSVSSLAIDENENTVIAVGMLAAAGLCEVSPKAVRLSVAGKEFVELLMGDEALVPIED